jgi:hypothetical protein
LAHVWKPRLPRYSTASSPADDFPAFVPTPQPTYWLASMRAGSEAFGGYFGCSFQSLQIGHQGQSPLFAGNFKRPRAPTKLSTFDC